MFRIKEYIKKSAFWVVWLNEVHQGTGARAKRQGAGPHRYPREGPYRTGHTQNRTHVIKYCVEGGRG